MSTENTPRPWFRAVAKACTYRILTTGTALVAAWFLTGDLSVVLGVGLWDVIVKSSLYVVHERAWARFTIGRG